MSIAVSTGGCSVPVSAINSILNQVYDFYHQKNGIQKISWNSFPENLLLLLFQEGHLHCWWQETVSVTLGKFENGWTGAMQVPGRLGGELCLGMPGDTDAPSQLPECKLSPQATRCPSSLTHTMPVVMWSDGRMLDSQEEE